MGAHARARVFCAQTFAIANICGARCALFELALISLPKTHSLHTRHKHKERGKSLQCPQKFQHLGTCRACECLGTLLARALLSKETSFVFVHLFGVRARAHAWPTHSNRLCHRPHKTVCKTQIQWKQWHAGCIYIIPRNQFRIETYSLETETAVTCSVWKFWKNSIHYLNVNRFCVCIGSYIHITYIFLCVNMLCMLKCTQYVQIYMVYVRLCLSDGVLWIYAAQTQMSDARPFMRRMPFKRCWLKSAYCMMFIHAQTNAVKSKRWCGANECEHAIHESAYLPRRRIGRWKKRTSRTRTK